MQLGQLVAVGDADLALRFVSWRRLRRRLAPLRVGGLDDFRMGGEIVRAHALGLLIDEIEEGREAAAELEAEPAAPADVEDAVDLAAQVGRDPRSADRLP